MGRRTDEWVDDRRGLTNGRMDRETDAETNGQKGKQMDRLTFSLLFMTSYRSKEAKVTELPRVTVQLTT